MKKAKFYQKIINRCRYADSIVQFIKFCAVGFSNTIISYLVYIVLYFMGLNYVISNIIGFLAGVINAFYWNNRYVFRKAETEERNIIVSFLRTFIAYAGTGLFLSNILLILWVEILNISKIIAPVINLLITIPLNFFLNKFWAFKK